jgi:hypothetical protein
MSGSITPGPSAGGRRRGVRARFWLLMTIGWVWVSGGSDRPAGTGRLSFNFVDCRECLKLRMTMPDGSPVKAKKMKNGWYQCRNGHRYRA